MVRELILDKLQELGLTMSEASLKIGKNHAYLQQFLRRGHPLELSEKSRLPLARLLGVPEEALRGPSAVLPARNHPKPEPKIITRRGADIAQPSISGAEPQNFLDNIRPLPEMVGRNLPVFGTTARGGDDASILSDHPVDWEAMPNFLVNVEGAYSVFVAGNAMDPEHKNGSTALVHPHLSPQNGDTCIFRCRKDDGVELAIVAVLLRFDDNTWYVSQHNSKKNFKLKRADWTVCHVIVGNYSRR